jgi:hypothetical protein
MSDGIDRLVNDVACLRLDVARLQAEVAVLRDQVADRDGELVALRVMLTAWPVQMPDNQPPVQH